jgi:hypothetical protein
VRLFQRLHRCGKRAFLDTAPVGLWAICRTWTWSFEYVWLFPVFLLIAAVGLWLVCVRPVCAGTPGFWWCRHFGIAFALVCWSGNILAEMHGSLPVPCLSMVPGNASPGFAISFMYLSDTGFLCLLLSSGASQYLERFTGLRMVCQAAPL